MATISPLLQALTEPLRPEQLGGANTLFTTWQRIADSQAGAHGTVFALHLVGTVLAVIAAAGALAGLALPAVTSCKAAHGCLTPCRTG